MGKSCGQEQLTSLEGGSLPQPWQQSKEALANARDVGKKSAGWKGYIPRGNKTSISTLYDLAAFDPRGSMPSLGCLWSHHWSTALTIQLGAWAQEVFEPPITGSQKNTLEKYCCSICYSFPSTYYWLRLESRYPSRGSFSLTPSSCFYVLRSREGFRKATVLSLS